MPVTVPPLAHPQYRQTPPLALALVALILFLLTVSVACGVSRALTDRSPQLHEYRGTTWVGDACFVAEDGTLWCQGGSV